MSLACIEGVQQESVVVYFLQIRALYFNTWKIRYMFHYWKWRIPREPRFLLTRAASTNININDITYHFLTRRKMTQSK